MGLLYQECVNVSYWSLIWTKIDLFRRYENRFSKNLFKENIDRKTFAMVPYKF